MKKPIARIEREQAEKLIELGKSLQQFRQQQGLSLEEVAARTMIPVRTLLSIEQGDRTRLPEPVYIQGFLRQYANAIGMNGAEVASSFPTQPIIAPVRRALWRGFALHTQLRPLHLYFLYTLLVVSAVSGLSYLLNRSASQMALVNPGPQTGESPKNPAGNLQMGPSNLAKPNAAGNPTAQASPAGSQKLLRVNMTLTAQSWIRVVADGKMEFEGVLPEGTKRTWVGDKQVVVRAGNAGGVLVSLNEGQVKQLGAPGSVEEVMFSNNSQAMNGANNAADVNLTAATSQALPF